MTLTLIALTLRRLSPIFRCEPHVASQLVQIDPESSLGKSIEGDSIFSDELS
jgi:hypothetical protein